MVIMMDEILKAKEKLKYIKKLNKKLTNLLPLIETGIKKQKLDTLIMLQFNDITYDIKEESMSVIKYLATLK